MKKYTSPELEIINLLTADVITMSVQEKDLGTDYENVGGVDMQDYILR
jgi:hypothetical protein